MFNVGGETNKPSNPPVEDYIVPETLPILEYTITPREDGDAGDVGEEGMDMKLPEE